MKDEFYKFPSTPHLALLGDVEVRNDKVMSETERDEFLLHELVVEEKMDGANLGISFDSGANLHTQNRGEYLRLPMGGQWKKLHEWLALREDVFFEHLTDRYVLFGEWCYAKHSIQYDRLPDWLIGFDVYDRQERRFLSHSRRDGFFRSMDLWGVPKITHGRFTLMELVECLSTSRFGDHPAEGLYLRHEKSDWLVQRAKLVRPAFIQSVTEHWSSREIIPNQLRIEKA